MRQHAEFSGLSIHISFLSQALMFTDASDAGGQILMSGMSFHRLSGRLHEIQSRTRPATRQGPMPQVLSKRQMPGDNEPPRESFEHPGSTVIDMTSLRARYSQDSISQPKTQGVVSKPSMATAREEVAESNAGASSAWLLAARSFSGKDQPISCCFPLSIENLMYVLICPKRTSHLGLLAHVHYTGVACHLPDVKAGSLNFGL